MSSQRSMDVVPREKEFWEDRPMERSVSNDDEERAPARQTTTIAAAALISDDELSEEGPLPREKEFWEPTNATETTPTALNVNSDDTDEVSAPPPPEFVRHRATNLHDSTPGAFSVSGQQMERRNTGFISPQERSKELQLRQRDAMEEAVGNKHHPDQDGNAVRNPHTPKETTPPSRRRLYLIGAAVLLVVVALVVVVVVLVTNNDNDSSPNMPPATDFPTLAPTLDPSFFEKLQGIRGALGALPSTTDTLDDLPEDPSFYVDLFDDESQPPNVRAVSWILYEDPLSLGPTDPELISRYALVTLYYAADGPAWTNNRAWLTQLDACSWEGVVCEAPTQGSALSRIVELRQDEGNLQNSLPKDMALLSDLVTVSLRGNWLMGAVPADAFHDIDSLQNLFLDSNSFTGTIDAVLAQGALSTLFVQDNNFDVGSLFPFCNGSTLILEQAGLDCDVLVCDCCLEEEHCF